MPLIVRFCRAVPEDMRADVQRRLFVTSNPPQEGIWHWFSATEVHYRPEGRTGRPAPRSPYRLATGGLPMGDGYYGRNDVTVVASVGPAVIMTVDNKTKQMTVTQDGKVLRRDPGQPGQAEDPLVQRHHGDHRELRKTVFDTIARAEPGERLPDDDRVRRSG